MTITLKLINNIFRRQQRYTQNDVIYANSFEILEYGASSSSLWEFSFQEQFYFANSAETVQFYYNQN